MGCEVVKVPGGVAIVCTRGRQKPKPCHLCGRASSKLCDFKSGGKTCDRPLCDACAAAITPEIDFCPEHPRG